MWLSILISLLAILVSPSETRRSTTGEIHVGRNLGACNNSSNQDERTNKSSSFVVEAPNTHRDCTSNTCREDGGCASCARLFVELPPDTKVLAIHCFTNAHAPDDFPKSELHEVACTQDNAWSIFESPIVKSGSSSNYITTVFHNRSSDRDRVVRLDVEWR